VIGNPHDGSFRLTHMRRALLLTILSTSWLLSALGAAHASCLAPPPIAQVIEDAPVVFVGTVVDFGGDARQAVVEVESVWKGEGVATLVSVDGGFDPNGATSVDRFYEPGIRYLFVPTSAEAPFMDNACTSTQPITDEIAALQPETAAAPVDGEAITFTTSGGEPGEAPPPGEGEFGSDEEPAVVVLGPIVSDGPDLEPWVERRPAAAPAEAGAVTDSYLLPMLVVGVAAALVIGGATVMRRLRTERID
jgi:hypothetical protein